MSKALRNIIIATSSGIALAVVLTQTSLAFIDLASQYLSDSSFDSLIFIGGAFLVSFFLMVISGWFADGGSFILALTASLSYVVSESFFRMARLSRVPAFDSLVKIWSVSDLFLTLIAALAGIFLGFTIGGKARKQEHIVRLYVFSAFFALIIISAIAIHGISAFNPLSPSRGVL